jgi:tetratricopeptide (TPR) repeat protein
MYGLTSGITCEWEEAEKGLLEAHAISKALNGDLYFPSRNLGLLKSEQGMYEIAAKYYEQAIKEMEERNHDVTDAYRYAIILKEYALILKKIGNSADSITYYSKSEAMLKTVEKSEIYTAPFGAYCKAP